MQLATLQVNPTLANHVRTLYDNTHQKNVEDVMYTLRHSPSADNNAIDTLPLIQAIVSCVYVKITP